MVYLRKKMKQATIENLWFSIGMRSNLERKIVSYFFTKQNFEHEYNDLSVYWIMSHYLQSSGGGVQRWVTSNPIPLIYIQWQGFCAHWRWMAQGRTDNWKQGQDHDPHLLAVSTVCFPIWEFSFLPERSKFCIQLETSPGLISSKD